MRKILFVFAAILLFAVLVSGCSQNSGVDSSKEPAPVQPDASGIQITIKDFTFSPATLTIKKGETVKWINEDSAPHTATGNGFDSGKLSTGDAFSFTFKEAGAFDYICTYHPNMKGKVIVE